MQKRPTIWGVGTAENPRKRHCMRAPFPAPHRHHSRGPGRGRESVLVIRPAVTARLPGVARARAVCVLPPSVGTPPPSAAAVGKSEAGVCRGAERTRRFGGVSMRGGGALTIQEETPSIAMERCEIARVCLARTT